MSAPFHVATIVEGHGETFAVPELLRRLVPMIDGNRWAEVLPPIRTQRSLIVKPGELERRVELAARLVQGKGGAVLVILDIDDDCAATVGPELLTRVKACRADIPSAVVLPVCEFEAWFLAAAASVAGKRGLPSDLQPPDDAEAIRDAKGWLQERRTDGLSYSPTTDQPALAATFDPLAARDGSASFDKLWRDVERLLGETMP